MISSYTFWVFISFLLVFLGTAAVGLLNMAGKIEIEDEATKKWLRRGLFAEVVAIMISMATMTLLNPGSTAWTVYGKVQFDRDQPSTSLLQTSVTVAPPTVKIDESGRFRVNVVINNHGPGQWDFPTLQLSAPGYGSKTVHFSDDFSMIAGEENEYKILIDENEKKIVIQDPITLPAIDNEYDESSGGALVPLEIQP